VVVSSADVPAAEEVEKEAASIDFIVTPKKPASMKSTLWGSPPDTPGSDMKMAARTPGAHINLGSLHEEEKVELDTPDQKQIARALSGGSNVTDFSGDGFASSYAGYDNITRLEASPAKLAKNQWVCTTCTVVNEKQHAWVCECCGAQRKDGKVATPDAKERKGKPVQKCRGGWSCKACSFENAEMSKKRCEMCNTRRDDDDAFEMGIEMPAEKVKGRGERGEKGEAGAKKKKGIFGRIKSIFGGN
jgi:hypothetical protein